MDVDPVDDIIDTDNQSDNAKNTHVQVDKKAESSSSSTSSKKRHKYELPWHVSTVLLLISPRPTVCFACLPGKAFDFVWLPVPTCLCHDPWAMAMFMAHS